MCSTKYGTTYRLFASLYNWYLAIVEMLANLFSNFGCYKYRKYARLPESLVGKYVLITGANTGMGKETARVAASRGAHVIMACRDEGRAHQAVDDIVKELGREELRDNLSVVLLNLSDLNSVRNAAEQINRQFTHLDVLINNAGVMMTPEWTTAQSHEFQFGTNHLGHFLLTNLLLDKLKAAPSGGARIVHVSAMILRSGNMHFNNLALTGMYTPMVAYARSKLANVLFNRELAKRLQGSGVHSYALHPGIVRTDLQRHISSFAKRISSATAGWWDISPEEGAQTQLYCAFDERAAHQSGLYYSNCTINNLPAHATDDAEAEKLWDLSIQLCGLDGKNPTEKLKSEMYPGNCNKNNKVGVIDIV